MASKHDEKPSVVTPGPGTYKKKNFVEYAKSISVGKEERGNALLVKEQLITPAPGSY